MVETKPAKPHDWKAGIRRIPLHLGAFGAPSFLVAYFLCPPGPWKWIPAVGMTVQAVRGEWDDVANGEDTVGKAIIDAASQSALAIVGALV
ncbi:MAG: hypothetical protein KGI66_02085 [Patescibacteria group bacterium]|nr:hypothetical protein [Patescibacteria group bacterium]